MYSMMVGDQSICQECRAELHAKASKRTEWGFGAPRPIKRY